MARSSPPTPASASLARPVALHQGSAEGPGSWSCLRRETRELCFFQTRLHHRRSPGWRKILVVPQTAPACVDENFAVCRDEIMSGSPVRGLPVRITGFHPVRALKKHRSRGPKDALPKTRLRRNSFPAPSPQEDKHTYNGSDDVLTAEGRRPVKGFTRGDPLERRRAGLARADSNWESDWCQVITQHASCWKSKTRRTVSTLENIQPGL